MRTLHTTNSRGSMRSYRHNIRNKTLTLGRKPTFYRDIWSLLRGERGHMDSRVSVGSRNGTERSVWLVGLMGWSFVPGQKIVSSFQQPHGWLCLGWGRWLGIFCMTREVTAGGIWGVWKVRNCLYILVFFQLLLGFFLPLLWHFFPRLVLHAYSSY